MCVAIGLEKLLGREIGTTYSKSEMLKLLQIQIDKGKFDEETGKTMTGALKYKDKLVKNVMTPTEKLFMFFRSVKEKYEYEGIDIDDDDDVVFSDNVEVLRLVEGQMGIISVLNEECVLPKGDEVLFVSKMKTMNTSKLTNCPRRKVTVVDIWTRITTIAFKASI